VALLITLVFVSYVESAPKKAEPTWDTAASMLLSNIQSIKMVDMTFRRSIYNSEKKKQKFFEHLASTGIDKNSVDINPAYLTPDAVCAFHWYVNGVRWLCERTTIYPRPEERVVMDFARYNGEFLYQYDGFNQLGEIKATSTSPGFYSSKVTNPVLGYPGYLKAILSKTNNNISFVFKQEEKINGEKCFTYQGESSQATAGKGRFSRVLISICPDKNYSLVRLVDETFLTNANGDTVQWGAATVYSAEELKMIDAEHFIPQKVAVEFYTINDSKLTWTSSEVYEVDSIKLNERATVSVFDREFPPGVAVSDKFNSPGSARYVGGNWAADVDNVTHGKHPSTLFTDGTKIDSPPVSK